METTQGKAVAAFTALARLSQKQMNSFAAYKLFRLKKALAPVVEFQSEQEVKIVQELGGTVSESGAINLDGEKRAEYFSRHKELEELKCDVSTEKLSMFMKELPDLTMADMESLDDFIDWKE